MLVHPESPLEVLRLCGGGLQAVLVLVFDFRALRVLLVLWTRILVSGILSARILVSGGVQWSQSCLS